MIRTGNKGAARREAQVGWSKVLTQDEQKQLWEYLEAVCRARQDVQTNRLGLMVDLMINTGMREVEIAKLRVRDTPGVLGCGVLEICDSKYRKDRTIQISNRLADAIATYISDIRPQTLPRHVLRKDNNRPVFFSRIGRPYTVRDNSGRIRASTAIYRQVRLLGKEAGIEKNLHPHIFRHTFAVNTLLSGVDIYTLQQVMGHSDISITARYLHLVASHLKGLGERLDSRI